MNKDRHMSFLIYTHTVHMLQLTPKSVIEKAAIAVCQVAFFITV